MTENEDEISYFDVMEIEHAYAFWRARLVSQGRLEEIRHGEVPNRGPSSSDT